MHFLPHSAWNNQLTYLRVVFKVKKALDWIEKEASVLKNLMTTSWKNWSWFLGLGSLLTISSAIALSADYVIAQQSNIVPDNTLGAESSIVTPNVDINGIKSEQLSGGAIRGANLFHSFQEFNVGQGRATYFANPVGIENILSRVTGSNASKILGRLGVLGNANLFLINPNGIIFGANASLDIRSSFVASTASSLKFADGKHFSATMPETSGLLTISVPIGLQLETNDSGTMKSAGNLTVGQNLTLAGGNLDLQGQLQAGENLTLQASDTVRLTDSAENPLIAKAGGDLIVQGQAVDIFALNHPTSVLLSGEDMVLRSANTVAGDAHYITGGNFRIEQLDGKLGNLFSPYDPIIRSRGNVTFNSYTGASLHILAGGSVNIPGNVTITGADTLANSIVENVTLSDGTSIVSINGNAQPTIDIRSGTNAFGLPGNTGSTAGFSGGLSTNDNRTSADIAIGSITNRGGSVFLTNQYNPNTSLSGGAIQVGGINTSSVVSGNAGSVTIDSRNSIKLNDTLLATVVSNGNGGAVTLKALNDITTNNIFTFVEYRGVGNGGNISLTSTQGAINTSAGRLDAGATFGNGGAITLNACNNITTGELNTSKVDRNAGIGNGGNISLTSTQGAIDTKAGTLYSFSDNGNGGAVSLQALNNITTGNISSFSQEGNGGDIALDANGSINTGIVSAYGGELSLLNRRAKKGNGGDITLKANGDINISNIDAYGGTSGGDITFVSNAGISLKKSTIFSDTYDLDGSGKAGDINIQAKSIIVHGTLVSAAAYNQGNGGRLTVNASELIEIVGTADRSLTGLFTGTAGTGNGGELTINTQRLTVEKGAAIASFTLGFGEAGDLTVNASESVRLSGTSSDARTPSALSADTAGAKNAGDLRISTGRLIVQDGAAVSASTFGSGQGGKTIVNATESVELSGASSNGFPSGLYAQSFGTGSAGDLTISTGQLTIKDKARITVAAGNAADINVPSGPLDLQEVFGFIVPPRSAEGNAGNLDIFARIIKLDNQAKITAETTFGNGGNITLQNLDLLLMRRGSEISTTAGTEQAGGNGGNINIKAFNGFIVAFPNENSDITANAYTGSGGKVKIKAFGIFGMVERSREDLVRLLGTNDSTKLNPRQLLTSDITAISQTSPTLSGTVTLNTPDIDPSRGLINLPSVPVDTEVVQGCYSPGYAQSKFVITGRGGLPTNPKDILTPDAAKIDWVSLKPSNNNRSLQPVTAQPTASTPKRIVEATGAVLNAKGQIVLTANSSIVSPHSSRHTADDCRNNLRFSN